jgi:hypothetical protein
VAPSKASLLNWQFRFTFLLAPQITSASSYFSGRQSRYGKKRLDRVSHRRCSADSPVPETALEGGGFKLLEAITGTQDLAMVVCDHPNIILLDLELPDIDGLEVIRRVREWAVIPSS